MGVPDRFIPSAHLLIHQSNARTDGQFLDDYKLLFSVLETKERRTVPTSIRFAM